MAQYDDESASPKDSQEVYFLFEPVLPARQESLAMRATHGANRGADTVRSTGASCSKVGSSPALRDPSYAFCFTSLNTATRRSGSAKPQNAPTSESAADPARATTKPSLNPCVEP